MASRSQMRLVLPALLLASALSASASAEPFDIQPSGHPDRNVAVGYKPGNGIGFMTANAVLQPWAHVMFDLQLASVAYRTDTGTARGYATTGAIAYRFRPNGHSPYVSLGHSELEMKLREVRGHASGNFANAGYMWRWASGFELIAGAGVHHLNRISATDGTTEIRQRGGWLPNLEAGVRYYIW